MSAFQWIFCVCFTPLFVPFTFFFLFTLINVCIEMNRIDSTLIRFLFESVHHDKASLLKCIQLIHEVLFFILLVSVPFRIISHFTAFRIQLLSVSNACPHLYKEISDTFFCIQNTHTRRIEQGCSGGWGGLCWSKKARIFRY